MSAGHQTAPGRCADRRDIVVVQDHTLVRQVVYVWCLDLGTMETHIVPTLDTEKGGKCFHCEKPYEPRREKTGYLHMRKQRRRSASR